MRHLTGLAAGLLLFSAGAGLGEGKAGVFDYYVLSLGWSATWCELTGDGRDDPQCDDGKGLTFTLHGLWPQYERGWPDSCFSSQADATRTQTAAMADIMGGAGLAWHEWKKHGRCSGLSAAEYFSASRAAYEAVTIPPVYAEVSRVLTLPADVVQEAFLEANPGLGADEITVTCEAGMIDEVRICLTKDLSPRRCGADVLRDCSLKDAELPPVR